MYSIILICFQVMFLPYLRRCSLFSSNLVKLLPLVRCLDSSIRWGKCLECHNLGCLMACLMGCPTGCQMECQMECQVEWMVLTLLQTRSQGECQEECRVECREECREECKQECLCKEECPCKEVCKGWLPALLLVCNLVWDNFKEWTDIKITWWVSSFRNKACQKVKWVAETILRTQIIGLS